MLEYGKSWGLKNKRKQGSEQKFVLQKTLVFVFFSICFICISSISIRFKRSIRFNKSNRKKTYNNIGVFLLFLLHTFRVGVSWYFNPISGFWDDNVFGIIDFKEFLVLFSKNFFNFLSRLCLYHFKIYQGKLKGYKIFYMANESWFYSTEHILL